VVKVNLAVRIAACAALVFIPLQGIDQWFYDKFFRFRVPRTAPSEIVIVRVDDAHIPELLAKADSRFSGERLSFNPAGYAIWYDSYYRELVRRIQTHRPRLVIFGTYYDWVHVDADSPTEPISGVLFSATLNAENKVIPPARKLTQNDNYGFSNAFPDSDNVVRKAFLVYSSASSLALKTFQLLKPGPVSRDLLDPLWIDFRGPPGHYPAPQASRFFENESELPGIEGKIVLIGRDENRALDFATPIGKMSRLEVLANTIETFLQDREIHPLSAGITRVVSVACIVLSIAITLSLPLNFSWVWLVGFSAIVLLSSLVALAELKLWLGVANPLLCILGTHLLIIGYRLGQQEESQWKLKQEAQYLKEMDQFKNNFISLFSHDLKTPIAKIKAITNRLLSDNPDLKPKIVESLVTLDKTNAELARFISDILKVTKMESMPVEPVKEVVDLNRLVEEAMATLKFNADEKNISVVADLEPLFSMEGDQKLLLEVIINLLENAIKYGKPSGRIIVRTREIEENIRVSVIDEGPGISTEELPRVTGKFYRGKIASTTTKGSGLGLYLAKYFVELHRGTLTISSTLGKGTDVSFTLPIK
jgi:signal transduction histidine kinase